MCVHQDAGGNKKKLWVFDIYQCPVPNRDDVNPLEDIAPKKMSLLKYAPVTSCDAEKSSSAYKHILSDKRKSVTPKNMGKIVILYCASKNQ
jgi:hypothetical protein